MKLTVANLLASIAPFDGDGDWKLKVDDAGKPVIQDGKPVMIKPDGSDFVVDVAGLYSKISSLTTEAANNRKAKETAEAALTAFGDMKPEDAKKALETVAALDQKQLIDAGKVEEVKSQITSTYEAKLAEQKKAFDELQSAHHGTLRAAAFGQSKFIADKMAVPAAVAEKIFGDSFKVENGKLVGYANGQPITVHPTDPTKAVDFDAALETIVGGYAHKDTLLKARGGSGSGSTGGNGDGGGARYSRSEFEKMAPAKQAQIAAQAREGKAEIVDG